MAKASRQPANHVPQARAPATSKSAPLIARQPVNAGPQAIGNQALQRLRRAPASGVSEVPPVSPDLERRLDAQAGGGEPLTGEQRSFFEPRFGRDLGGVRFHTDQQAASAAREVSAQAFTRGQDIYFGDRQYQPHSDAGRRLMAHELTHTIQQSASSAPPGPEASGPETPASEAPVSQAPAQMAVPSASAGLQRSADPSVIRRAGTPPAAPGATSGTPVMTLATGTLEETTNTITFDKIDVPIFKTAAHRGALYTSRKGQLIRRANYTRGNTAQRDLWKAGMSADVSAIVDKLSARYKKAFPSGDTPATYIFKSPESGQPRYFIGDLPTIAKEMTLPYWTVNGDYRRYDVDHIVELQLGNWGADAWANTLPNMELLDSKINSSSGSTIEKNIEAKATLFVDATKKQYGDSAEAIKKKYHMNFMEAVGGDADKTPKDEYWEQKDIRAGEQVIDKLSVLTAEGLGSANKALIFPGAAGTPKQFTTGAVTADEAGWLKPYILKEKTLKTDAASKDSADFGTLTFTLPEDHKDWKATTTTKIIPVTRVPGAQYAGMIDKNAVRDELRTWRKTGLSPITISEFDITPEGMVVNGQISLEDISILKGVSVDFELSNGSLTFSKEFALGDFTDVPKPFTVKNTTLKVSAGTATGVTVAGKVDFGVDKVGEGYIGAAVGTSTDFALEGGFSFDPNLFAPPAKIDMSYTNNEIKASGVLTIPPGKVTGIKKATVTASYDAGEFKATGTADLDMPAVQQASMDVKYSEAVGLEIKGKASLKDDVPGIKSGSVEAEVKQGELGWMVSATGTATSTIAGFDTALTISYTEGIFTAEATAGYKTSKLAGTITVGATNRAVDADGKPTGGASEKLSAFGGGTIEATLTPWLKGQIGVRLKPEGGVIVSGRIGLPAPIELFPEKKVDTTLFAVNTTIPTPIPGVIVKIGGSLTAYASFGPGQLKDASISVTYDPDHEDDTTITGSATFYVPASAGLELGVSAGIGVGITGASASGNLEIKGGLGLTAFAQADAVVNWSPKKGLDLTATGTAQAQPSFTFKINGFFLVEALGFEIWKPTWNLASFKYGANLTVGVTFPIHYHEGEPFNPSWSDVTFQKPDINVDELLSGLLHATGF